MFPQKSPIDGVIDSKTYPLGEKNEHSTNGRALALVALSHSAVEHQLYSAMLSHTENGPQCFTARQLKTITGVRSLSTIRRGLEGLIAKFSIERSTKPNGGAREPGASYIAFTPEQVIARRNEHGLQPNGKFEGNRREGNWTFERALARVAENKQLSRREAQVALCCVEGLTNAEIGNRLEVSEQTVKFHLRHIFVKFGVKRRAELISRLLM
jgi:DNA-binding CsgD family transcriptional regulator